MDDDGLSELYEYLSGTDPLLQMTDGVTYDSMADADQDGMDNFEEQLRGLNPGNPDSDDDGYGDWHEVYTSKATPRSSRSPDKKDAFPLGQTMSFPERDGHRVLQS